MPTHSPSSPSPPPRAGRSRSALILFAVICLAVLAADLGLKSWSFARVAGAPVVLTRDSRNDPDFWRRHAHEPVVVIPGVLNLALTTNTGAVFGMGKRMTWFYAIISVAASILVPALFWRSRVASRWLHIGLALIEAGALGNLYDRVRFEAVRDMLWLFPTTGLWPWIFNLADAALMVGVALVLLVNWNKPAPGRGTARG